jgi:hypothetical protein
MSAPAHQISCRLYLDGTYTPFLDEDNEISYMPSSHEQYSLELGIQTLVEQGDLLGDKEISVDFFDERDMILSYGRGTTPFPQIWLDKFMGKSFRIYPSASENPWGSVFVEFVPFGSPPPSSAPVDSRAEMLKCSKEELRALEARMLVLKESIASLEGTA